MVWRAWVSVRVKLAYLGPPSPQSCTCGCWRERGGNAHTCQRSRDECSDGTSANRSIYTHARIYMQTCTHRHAHKYIHRVLTPGAEDQYIASAVACITFMRLLAQTTHQHTHKKKRHPQRTCTGLQHVVHQRAEALQVAGLGHHRAVHHVVGRLVDRVCRQACHAMFEHSNIFSNRRARKDLVWNVLAYTCT